MWTDYNHVTSKRSSSFYPSNFTPLWANATQLTQAEIVGLLLRHSPYWNYPAGVPTSLVNTTQQWDFPNAWAPLQYWIIEALRSQPKTVAIATSLVQRVRKQTEESNAFPQWITTNYCAWNNTGGNVSGIMFEKYNAIDVGQPGQGGEYAVQDGFGWTNGVVLRYLTLYGNSLILPSTCPTDTARSFYVNAHHEHVDLCIDQLGKHDAPLAA